jgi:flagella basal body P-ring formation protein FlgA
VQSGAQATAIEPSSRAAVDAEVSKPAMPRLAAAFDELDLVAELERLLSDRLQPAGRLRLIPLSRVPETTGFATLPTISLIDHPSRLTTSSTVLRFQLSDDAQTYGPYAVSFRVQILADVWLSRRRLNPGEELNPADFSTREADLVREPKAVPADAKIFGRYEIARAVATERPLQWSDLAPRALVQKGGIVDVVANDGRLFISMKGLATRGGALGDSITIRNLESKREFAAEVIDENRVRVHF